MQNNLINGLIISLPIIATGFIASMSFSDDNIRWFFGQDFNVLHFRVFVFSVGILSAALSSHVASRRATKIEHLELQNRSLASKLGELEGVASSTQNELNRKNDLLQKQKSESFRVIHDMLGKLILEKAYDLYGSEPPSDFRITVYSHRQDSDTFSQVGRYSARPDFNRVGRESYSLRGGAIGSAWQNGSCAVEGLPDPEVKPRDYKRELVGKWQMAEDEVDNLRMKSRAMKALRIKGGRDNKEYVGVLLVETTNSVLSEEHLRLLEKVFTDEDGVLKRVIHHEYELHKKLAS